MTVDSQVSVDSRVSVQQHTDLLQGCVKESLWETQFYPEQIFPARCSLLGIPFSWKIAKGSGRTMLFLKIYLDEIIGIVRSYILKIRILLTVRQREVGDTHAQRLPVAAIRLDFLNEGSQMVVVGKNAEDDMLCKAQLLFRQFQPHPHGVLISIRKVHRELLIILVVFRIAYQLLFKCYRIDSCI